MKQPFRAKDAPSADASPPPFQAAPDAATEQPASSDWLPMSDAPHDGTVILLTDGEFFPGGVPAQWRMTRKIVDKRWSDVGVWADPMTTRQIDFVPTGWRTTEDPHDQLRNDVATAPKTQERVRA